MITHMIPVVMTSDALLTPHDAVLFVLWLIAGVFVGLWLMRGRWQR